MASFTGTCDRDRETIPAPPSVDRSTSNVPERMPSAIAPKLPLRLSLVLAAVDGATDVGRITDSVGFAPAEVYSALLDLEALGLVKIRSLRSR